jgi:hypothetical protein
MSLEEDIINETKMNSKRNYKTIKWILKNHVKNKVKSLWTYENDNFTCIYKNYNTDSNIYTPQQMLKEIDNLIKKENANN